MKARKKRKSPTAVAKPRRRRSMSLKAKPARRRRLRASGSAAGKALMETVLKVTIGAVLGKIADKFVPESMKSNKFIAPAAKLAVGYLVATQVKQPQIGAGIAAQTLLEVAMDAKLPFLSEGPMFVPNSLFADNNLAVIGYNADGTPQYQSTITGANYGSLSELYTPGQYQNAAGNSAGF